VFIAASTHSLGDLSFNDACFQIGEMGYDKVEIWMNEESDHLKPSEVTDDPEKFASQFREHTRLTPVAFSVEHDVDVDTLAGLSRAAKLLRVTQIILPASPLGTPFNTEIDRLRSFVSTTSGDGVQVSLKTKTGHLTEDPHTAVELCQAVKGLGIALDPSYYICGPAAGQTFNQVFPYVNHVQLRDTTPNEIQVKIGLGEIDYGELIAELQDQNYRLSLSVDLIPELTSEEDRPLEMRKLQRLLDSMLI